MSGLDKRNHGQRVNAHDLASVVDALGELYHVITQPEAYAMCAHFDGDGVSYRIEALARAERILKTYGHTDCNR